jgi:fatty-acyl-CoA synthase
VFPAEVENLYCRRDDVLLAAMLSYPDGDLGEKIAVFLQMKNANHPSAEEIREYAAAHLAKFKVPDKVLFIAEMPMLPSGKVDRVKLTEHLQKQRV